MTSAEFRQIRLAAGLSPDQLCERLRLATGPSGRRYIRMIETGRRGVSGPVSVLMEQIRDTPPRWTRTELEAMERAIGPYCDDQVLSVATRLK
jgi:transcriptional regulator with XRE-family HTH domain